MSKLGMIPLVVVLLLFSTVAIDAVNVTTDSANVTAIDPVTGNQTTTTPAVDLEQTGITTPKLDDDNTFTLNASSTDGAFLKFSDGGLNFQLYPEAAAEDYLWVKFYSLAERDYLQAGVPGRIIDNFAGQVKGATITQGKQYGADYVQAMFTLSQIDGFSLKCPGATVNSADAWVTITTFVTSVPTSFPYGGVTYPASPGAAKFNVELTAWPFCNTSNSLLFKFEFGSSAVAVLPAPSIEDDSAGLGRLVKTKMGNGQDVSFYMPMRAYLSPSSTVALQADPGLDVGELENPRLTVTANHFASSFYYDPLSTVTGVAIEKSPSPSPSPKRSPSPTPSPIPSPAKPPVAGVTLVGSSPAPTVLTTGSSASTARLPFSLLLALLASTAVVLLV